MQDSEWELTPEESYDLEPENISNPNFFAKLNQKDRKIQDLKDRLMELDRDYANLKCRVLSKMVNEQERDDKEKEKWMVKYMALMRTYKHDKKISNSYKMDAQSKIKSLLQFSQDLLKEMERREDEFMKCLKNFQNQICGKEKNEDEAKIIGGNKELKIVKENSLHKNKTVKIKVFDEVKREIRGKNDKRGRLENKENIDKNLGDLKNMERAKELDSLEKRVKTQIKKSKSQIRREGRPNRTNTYKFAELTEVGADVSDDTDVEDYDLEHKEPVHNHKRSASSGISLFQKEQLLLTQESLKNIVNKNIESQELKGITLKTLKTRKKESIFSPRYGEKDVNCVEENRRGKYKAIYENVLENFYEGDKQDISRSRKSSDYCRVNYRSEGGEPKREIDNPLFRSRNHIEGIINTPIKCLSPLGMTTRNVIFGEGEMMPQAINPVKKNQEKINGIQQVIARNIISWEGKKENYINANKYKFNLIKDTIINNQCQFLNTKHNEKGNKNYKLGGTTFNNLNNMNNMNNMNNLELGRSISVGQSKPLNTYGYIRENSYSNQHLPSYTTYPLNTSTTNPHDIQISKIMGDESLNITEKEQLVFAILNSSRTRTEQGEPRDAKLEDLLAIKNSTNNLPIPSINISLNNSNIQNISNFTLNLSTLNNQTAQSNNLSALNNARLDSIKEEEVSHDICITDSKDNQGIPKTPPHTSSWIKQPKRECIWFDKEQREALMATEREMVEIEGEVSFQWSKSLTGMGMEGDRGEAVPTPDSVMEEVSEIVCSENLSTIMRNSVESISPHMEGMQTEFSVEEKMVRGMLEEYPAYPRVTPRQPPRYIFSPIEKTPIGRVQESPQPQPPHNGGESTTFTPSDLGGASPLNLHLLRINSSDNLSLTGKFGDLPSYIGRSQGRESQIKIVCSSPWEGSKSRCARHLFNIPSSPIVPMAIINKYTLPDTMENLSLISIHSSLMENNGLENGGISHPGVLRSSHHQEEEDKLTEEEESNSNTNSNTNSNINPSNSNSNSSNSCNSSHERNNNHNNSNNNNKSGNNRIMGNIRKGRNREGEVNKLRRSCQVFLKSKGVAPRKLIMNMGEGLNLGGPTNPTNPLQKLNYKNISNNMGAQDIEAPKQPESSSRNNIVRIAFSSGYAKSKKQEMTMNSNIPNEEGELQSAKTHSLGPQVERGNHNAPKHKSTSNLFSSCFCACRKPQRKTHSKGTS